MFSALQKKCDEAMAQITKVRAGMVAKRRRRDKTDEKRKGKGKGKGRSVAEEMKALFGRRGGKTVWKHSCLAQRNQTSVPTSDSEKDDLFEAGLWEKEVHFGSLDLDAEGFKEVIINHFPKLKDGGGYQFCRCLQNSRRLEPLSVLAHSSPSLLKQRVGNARTYIRPLQKDLDLSPMTESHHEEVWQYECNNIALFLYTNADLREMYGVWDGATSQ